jgi:hypothetical protein
MPNTHTYLYLYLYIWWTLWDLPRRIVTWLGLRIPNASFLLQMVLHYLMAFPSPTSTGQFEQLPPIPMSTSGPMSTVLLCDWKHQSVEDMIETMVW